MRAVAPHVLRLALVPTLLTTAVFLLAPAAAVALERLPLADSVPWLSRAGEPPGPEVAAVADGWRFRFAAGSGWTSGYAQVPLPGDDLRTRELVAVEVTLRGAAGVSVDAVLVSTDETYRAPLDLRYRGWRRVTLPVAAFRSRPDGWLAPPDPAFRYFRLECPFAGLTEPTELVVESVTFLCRERGGEITAPVSAFRHSGGSPLFPLGLFVLGGNRSLLPRLGVAGANVVVEYGPRSWPRPSVEDHLDYARGAGVRVGAALTWERHGAIIRSDERLDSLSDHPGLWAWYLFDEPDGGGHRGLAVENHSPERLRWRRRLLRGVPSLVACLTAKGLARYVDSAELLATDLYLPAYGPSRSLAAIHSEAESVVEVAARHGKTPLLVIQLADPVWSEPAQRQTVASLRAQTYAALAAGVRGLLYYQGVTALRLASREADAGLWDAFLELSAEVATLAPVAAHWQRLPGEPRLEPAVGEVRAAAFAHEDDHWLVLVNLGRAPAAARLGGAVLADAVRLEAPWGGWSGEVVDGTWSGSLAAGEGHVVRVVRADAPAPGSEPVSVLERLPFPTPDSPLGFGDVVLGATLYPAPGGPIRLLLDEGAPAGEVVVHRGAAAVVRCRERALAPGRHEVAVLWEEEGAERREAWTFEVQPTALPFADDFARTQLGPDWTPCTDGMWNFFDPEELPPAGTARITNGRLHVVSTAGSFGVLLRRVEAPPSHTLTFTARLPEAGHILLHRNELVRKVRLERGESRVVWQESPGAQRVTVNGTLRGSWTPTPDHQGGEIGLGVFRGGEAWFDEVVLRPE